jgi:hypothetical protein
MEKHYVFKSLFEDNITQVSSIGAEHWGLLWNACSTHRIFSGVRTFRGRQGGLLSTVDAVVLNCVTQFNIVWHVGTFPFLPMSKGCQKTLRYRSGIVLKKKVSTAHAQCSSDQRCMMTEGFKLLYPAMCVSPRHLQRWRLQIALLSYVCFTTPPTKMSEWR